MKFTLLTLALAATALFGFTSTAEAGTKGDILKFVGKQIVKKNHGGHHGGHYGCEPAPYVVNTIVVSRHSEPLFGYRPCGGRYTYYVTVTTYRSFYSNGSSRTYTKVA